MTKTKTKTFLLGLVACTLLVGRAEARGCSEQSTSRAVGLASCHRFGDWDLGGWSPSFATGFVFRTIPLPNSIDVCAPSGKSCTKTGSLLASRPETQRVYGGVIDVTPLGWGPARFGMELGVGGGDGTVTGQYGGATIRSSNFLFASAALKGGLAFGFGRFGLRFDGLLGIAGLSADVGVKDANGKSLEVQLTYPQLEGRGTLLFHVNPWVALGGFGGFGYGEIWHAGALVRLSLNPWDGTHD